MISPETQTWLTPVVVAAVAIYGLWLLNRARGRSCRCSHCPTGAKGQVA